MNEELTSSGWTKQSGVWTHKEYEGLAIWEEDGIWYCNLDGMLCDCHDPRCEKTPKESLAKTINWLRKIRMDKPGTAIAALLESKGYSNGCPMCQMLTNVLDSRGTAWCKYNLERVERWVTRSAKRQGWLTAILYNEKTGEDAIKALIDDALNAKPQTDTE